VLCATTWLVRKAATANKMKPATAARGAMATLVRGSCRGPRLGTQTAWKNLSWRVAEGTKGMRGAHECDRKLITTDLHTLPFFGTMGTHEATVWPDGGVQRSSRRCAGSCRGAHGSPGRSQGILSVQNTARRFKHGHSHWQQSPTRARGEPLLVHIRRRRCALRRSFLSETIHT